MNEQEALSVLSRVKQELGRNYKSAIRQAWFDGNYRSQSLEQWASTLQQVRNVFGPSWLVRARPL